MAQLFIPPEIILSRRYAGDEIESGFKLEQFSVDSEKKLFANAIPRIRRRICQWSYQQLDKRNENIFRRSQICIWNESKIVHARRSAASSKSDRRIDKKNFMRAITR